MMINNYKFDIMNKNELVAEVEVFNNNISVIKHNHQIGIQPFYTGEATIKRIERFLKSRCFDESRPDKKELLSYLELKENNIYAIIKKTHGRMFHDYLWIKFPEESLTWEDLENGQDRNR